VQKKKYSGKISSYRLYDCTIQIECQKRKRNLKRNTVPKKKEIQCPKKNYSAKKEIHAVPNRKKYISKKRNTF
jgi:hypothetical protein